MLGFCMSFFAADIRCTLKKNMQKLRITTKDWPSYFDRALHKKQYLWQVSQKLICIRRGSNKAFKYVVGKMFSKRVRKTPCLLETSE